MVKPMLFLLVIISICTMCQAANVKDQLSGLITGKTGELLDIRLEQPVEEGTIFQIRPILSEPPVAEALVLSCTKEWPFVALAKVTQADPRSVVPIGAKAYADANTVDKAHAPKPMKAHNSVTDDLRLSIQAGTFFPRPAALRSDTTNFWEEYRINYSFLKADNFELALAGGYLKGSGDSLTRDGGTVTKTIEVVPLTMFGRLRAIRYGGLSLVVGGGAGMYRIKSTREVVDSTTSNKADKFGQEFSAGIESNKGWLMELRYRNVPDSLIQGFSLAFGARF